MLSPSVINDNESLRNTLNDFTKECVDANNFLKNGNTLKMELELKALRKLGYVDFLNGFEYINSEVQDILDNIRVSNH